MFDFTFAEFLLMGVLTLVVVMFIGILLGLYVIWRVLSKSHLGTLIEGWIEVCLLYTSPSPRDGLLSRMPSSA